VEFFSHQTNYPFMATRKVWYTLSAVLMVASFVLFFTRGLNLGIDFTGGVSAQATFSHAPSVDEVRSKLASAGFRFDYGQSSPTTGYPITRNQVGDLGTSFTVSVPAYTITDFIIPAAK